MIFSSSCITLNVAEQRFIYESLILEVQPTINHGCDAQELETAKQYLDIWKICHADNVQIIINPPVSHDQTKWSTGDAMAFEMIYRRQYPTAERPSLYISYVSGSYSGELTGIIGINYDSDGILIFDNDYRGSHRLTTLLHEILHAIGLVKSPNRDAPVNPKRPRHCNNQTCTMFWIVPTVPKLCTLCQKDLQLMIH